MTQQEMFDKVWQKFVVEKKQKSFNGLTHSCRYFSPNGTRCAVGWLVPEELEGTVNSLSNNEVGVHILCNRVPSLRVHIGDNSSFLSDLQRCHDGSVDYSGAVFTSLVKGNLKRFATRYGLTIPA